MPIKVSINRDNPKQKETDQVAFRTYKGSSDAVPWSRSFAKLCKNNIDPIKNLTVFISEVRDNEFSFGPTIVCNKASEILQYFFLDCDFNFEFNSKTESPFDLSLIDENYTKELWEVGRIKWLFKNTKTKVFTFNRPCSENDLMLIRKAFPSEQLWLKQEETDDHLKRILKSLHIKTHSFPRGPVVNFK